MTGPAPDLAAEQVRMLRDFAALSGSFDPGLALTVVQDRALDPARVISLSAHLARLCDTRQVAGGSAWLMRGPERRWVLDELANEGRLRERIAWRRDLGGTDGDTGELLDALLGQGRFAPAAVRRALEAGSRAELSGIAVALERAGRPAPAFGQLDDVRAALTRLEVEERSSVLLDAGVEGRDDELAVIGRWLDAPSEAPPVRTLFIGGSPGLGKSTLLEAAVRTARTSPLRWIVVRLDFARRGLDVQDPAGLTIELARQVAGELRTEAHVLRRARLDAAGSPLSDLVPRLEGRGTDRLPVALAGALAAQVRAAGRPVLVVLDTLEIVRGRGETHPERLFRWLDALVGLGLHPVAVLAAGRGDALDGVPDRVGGRLDLSGLDEASADRMLAALDVPTRHAPVLRRLAQGNPLVLRHAPSLLTGSGAAPGAAPTTGQPPSARSPLLRLRAMTIRGDALHLVVRRVSADLIADVLAPHLGLGAVDRAGAAQLFDELGRQTWLVGPDPVAPGFLRYRPDVRRVLLRRLYETRLREAATVDRAAAEWFAVRPESWAAVEAAYHRLQGMRRTARPPSIPAAVLRRFDAETIADLPPRAQDVVRRARGDRSSLARGAVPPGRPPATGAAAELAAIVERGDWLEGAYVYEQAFRDRPFEARSPEGDAALAFLWRSGQWREARRLLGRRDRPRPDDGDLGALAPHLAAPRLEMRAELTFSTLVRALTHDPRLAGVVTDVAYSGLRSELSDGALGFAARRAGLVRRASSWHGVDAVGAAFEAWSSSSPGRPGSALAAAQERLARRLGHGMAAPYDSVATALLLSVLSPYADAAVTLGRVRGDPALERYAAAVDAHLAGLGGLLPTGSPAGAVLPQPVEPIDGLAALGLFAEWAGAAAFLHRDPDLRILASRAERWRRTVAGQWSYDAPTGDVSSWTRRLDVTLADRLSALRTATDPTEASHAQLAAWSAADRTGATPMDVRLERRLPGALRPAREAVPEGPAAVAGILLEHRVPAAFVPPLAVLLVHRDRPRPHPTGLGARRLPPAAGGPAGPPRVLRQENAMPMNDERVESIRTRLAESPELAAAVREALVSRRGPGPIDETVTDEQLDAVAADRQPLESVLDIDALEAIVQRVGRPPLLVRNDAVELEPLVDFPPGTDALIAGVQACIPSVGRVEFLNHRLSWGGTGWVIDADGDARVVATNRHVAKLVAQRTADGRGVFLRSPASGVRYGMDIDFKEEVGSSGALSRAFAVRDVIYLADDAAPDIALLRLTGAGLPDPLELADAEVTAEELVALIGYPAFDSRNNADDQARYFRDLYDVKRFAPGRVLQALSGRTVLKHDCTSLGGNSGSPLISLTSGRVVGLHFAGVYGVANSAVGVGSLKRALGGQERAVLPITRPSREDDEERAGDGHHTAAQLHDRGGYDPGFLDGRPLAPWPGLPERVTADLARPSDATDENPFELRYTHFGVRFSASRRQPVMTAVNIDGAHAVRIKRDRDRWFSDGRLPAGIQLRKDDYDDAQIDRGHMVRREDPNWDVAAAGPADVTALAEQANDDTFHYTNAAVQHSAMNQGKDLWLGLEDYILDSARTEGFRACVFTGPVHRDDDPEIKDGVTAPREFWKLVVMPDADRDGLHATAYLLSQGDLIRELLEKRNRTEAVEGFELGAYRTFQIAVGDLADATEYDFSAYLDADPLGRLRPDTEAAEALPLYFPLEGLSDVRLSRPGPRGAV